MVINPLLLLSILLISSASAFPFNFSTPWDSFYNLSDCRLGDDNPAIALLKTYLANFGYLTSATNFSSSFDESLASALLTYQHNFGLNATGSLDLPTIDQLVTPRCGIPDIINGTSSMSSSSNETVQGRKLYAYFPGEPTWPSSRRSLTYALTSTSASKHNIATLRTVFARAFARWAAATTLTFTELAEGGDPSDADIAIGFYSGNHGDGESFDGVLGTLAHAFSPTDGRFHLDSAEEWVVEGDSGSEVAVDLESVAVHEIGHLLGLGHSSVAESIMYPTIKTRTRKVELARDDVDGIQKLYGSNPTYKGVTPTGSSTTSTTSQERDTNDGGPTGGVGAVGRLLAGLLVVLLAVY